MIRVQLDVGELEQWPTDRLPGFDDALVAALLPRKFQAIEGLDRLGPAVEARTDDSGQIIALVRKMVIASGLGPSTAALVAEAPRRRIPAMRLDTANLIQSGTGSRQCRIRASATSSTSLIGAELAANKHAAKELLQAAGPPAPRGAVVRSADEAIATSQRIGWPVVIKPLDGKQGRGTTTGLRNEAQALEAFERRRSQAQARALDPQCHAACVKRGRRIRSRDPQALLAV